MIAWDKLNTQIRMVLIGRLEASDKMKKAILNEDHQTLINYRSQGKAFDLSIPTQNTICLCCIHWHCKTKAIQSIYLMTKQLQDP